MLSKRNYKERLRQMEQRTERFSIRKLTVGAASVLIGISFLGFNGHTAKAATTDTVKPNQEVANTQSVKSVDDQSKLDIAVNSSAAASNEQKASEAPASQSVASSAASSEEVKADSVSSSAAVNSEATNKVAVASSAASETVASAASSVASSAAKNDNVITSNSNGTVTGKNAQGTWAAKDATQGVSMSATNWDELANALNNATVTTIDLQGDITVDDSSNVTTKPNPVIAKNKLQFTGNNISRTLTINGNGHTINFGDYYFEMSKENKVGLIHTNGNRAMATPWDVTFNDVTINANKTNPFGFDGNTNNAPSGDAYNNQKYDKVTFKDSNATIKEGSLIDSANVNVQFSGDNKITLQSIINKHAGIDANSVQVLDGTTIINAASPDKTGGGVIDGEGMNVILVTPHNASDFSDPTTAYDSLHVAKDSTLTINANTKDQDGNLINSAIPNQYDLRGIVTRGMGVANASDWTDGTLTIDGNLNETLGSGHSSAIMARNLTISETGNVNILTQQDNEHDGFENSVVGAPSVFNGFHDGVIALNVGGIQSSNIQAKDSTLTDNGTLKIVRKDVPATNKADGKVNAPLIVFGTYGTNPVKYTMNVGESATLDLQDQASAVSPGLYSGDIMTNTPFFGLINMYGKDSNDVLSFTKPAYVNLQRTGQQTGTLIRLEGEDGKNSGNTIQLNGATPGGTPLSQWDTGNYTDNPSNTWRIQNLTAQDAKANNSILGYQPVKGSKEDHTLKFLQSNGAVTLTMDKTGQVVYKRNGDGQVINDPQGTVQQEVQLNNFLNNFNFWTPQRISFGNKAAISQSIYAPTDVQQGTTKTVNPTVFNKPADTPQQDQIKTTYAKTDDTPAWVSVDENTGALTLAPTADNSKVGMYNVPVLVTYTDQTNSGESSTQTVFAPVFVTDGNETVVWPKDPEGNLNGAIVITTDPSTIKAHETSDNNMDLKADAAVKSIDEYQMDTVNTISTTPTNIAKDGKGITISWGTEPSTVVPEATASETIKGTVNVTFDKDSQPFADQVVDQDNDYTTSSDLSIDAPGAVAQEKAPATPVKTKTGDKLTADQFKELVNTTIPADEIAYETLQSVDKDNAVVRITFNDKDAKGQNTYLDVKVPVSYVSTTTDANEYNPSYNPVNVNKGGSVETGIPTYTDKDGKTTTAPEGTTYTIPEGTKLPEGVTAKIDPNTGNVTVTTSDNTPEGVVSVPVTVTYPDGTTDTIDAPIIVGASTFIGTDYSVSVSTDLNNLHETTKNSMYPDASDLITKVTYWNNNDIRAGKNLDGTTVYTKGNGNAKDALEKAGITVDWNKDQLLNTNVTTPSLTAYPKGVDTDTVSDSNPQINISFAPTSEVSQKVGVSSMKAQWYGDSVSMVGAVAKNPAKPVEVNAGVNELTSDQLAALLDNSKVEALTANRPVSYTWANPLKVGDKTGTVRITFEDKAADGTNTYLDVALPADSLNVTGENATGTPIVTEQGKMPNPADGIGNKDELDPKTTYTWTNGDPDVSKIGTHDVSITVHYPDGKTQTVDTPLIVTGTEIPTNPNDPSQADLFKTVTRTIDGTTPDGKKVSDQPEEVIFARTKTVDKNGETTYGEYKVFENGKQTDKTTGSFAKVDVPQVDGYTTYVDGKAATEVPAVNDVTPETKSSTVNVTYTEKGKTPTYGENATGTPIVTEQGKMPNPADGIGNKDELDPKTTYTWTNGDPDVSKIGTHDVSITVHYPDGKTQTVDTPLIVTGTEIPTNPNDPSQSDLFTKVTRNITVNTPGAEPKTTVQTAEFARTKTVDKSGKTTYSDYTVYNTDTNKLTNDKEATLPKVSVDQIDGYTSLVDGKEATEVPALSVNAESKPADVNVTYTKKGKNPTDADKYTPKPAPITTDKGHTPDPSEGIGNKGDLPDGTKYSWTNGDPDVNTIGTKPVTITVTYPDGSQETVGTTITVKEPTAPIIPTDADTHVPEPKPITTDKGHMPDPSEGIGNKDDMPQGTKYTWTNGEPDVNTIGTKPVTITVTYPDGSVDNVTTTITVNDSTTPAPTDDAGKYTPEPAPITTDKGHMPDPSEGIGNKDNLPDGTKYSWTNGDPDVNTVGTHDVSITVTYPDGSHETVGTTITVKEPTAPTDADKYTPEPAPITTDKGHTPDPSEGIGNKGDLPTGTKYSWTNGAPDVSTVGTHEVSITVTYPDGSTDTITTTITVTDGETSPVHNTDGNGNNGNGTTTDDGTAGVHETTVNTNGNGNVAHTSFYNTNNGDKNNGNANANAKTLPQTGAEANMAGLLGLMIASVGAILGLAADKKRKN